MERPTVGASAIVAASRSRRPLLAATAQVLGLTLVTADERLLALKDITTLSNR